MQKHHFEVTWTDGVFPLLECSCGFSTKIYDRFVSISNQFQDHTHILELKHLVESLTEEVRQLEESIQKNIWFRLSNFCRGVKKDG